MTDSILIVGGGVAGLTAAGLCVEAGARAIVAEAGPVIGGRLAPLVAGNAGVQDSVTIPRLDDWKHKAGAEVITLAGLTALEGRPGNFTVSLRERARFVTEDCTRCGHCRPVCPAVMPNEYDQGLTYRKAIYTPLPDAVPPEYVIDIDSCLNTPPNYLPCNRCTEVCDDDAIRFDQPAERLHQRQVGAVIISIGLDIADGGSLADTGYGVHPDVVTSAELGRLLMAPGPTGGFAARPSNEQYPDRVLWLLDELTPRAIATAAGQVQQLLDQGVGKVTVLSTTQASGSESALLDSLPENTPVAWGLLQSIEKGADNAVTVTYADFSGTRVPSEDYDLVVIGSDVTPAAGLAALAGTVGCELNEAGYVATPDAPYATTRPGVFVAGSARGPVTLSEAVAGGQAAAVAALTQLDPRLLKPGYVPAGSGAADADDHPLSLEEVQQRIARALDGLIQ